MTITQELYPDIFHGTDPNDPTNIERKRLYLAIRHLLREYFMIDRAEPFTTADPRQFPENFVPDGSSGVNAHEHNTDEKIRFVSIFGQMLLSGHDDPAMGRFGRFGPRDITNQDWTWSPAPAIDPDAPKPGFPADSHAFGTEPNPRYVEGSVTEPERLPFRVHIVPEFVAKFTEAVQNYNANAKLYEQVFIKLREEGTGAANGSSTHSSISCKRVAEVTKRLVTLGVSPMDPYIRRHVINAMSESLGGVVDAHPSSLDIDLPDLDAGSGVEILPDNVKAVSAIYYSAQLEESKLHAVMDKIVEHFQTGMLPISRGAAADRIYEWIKRTPERLGEFERRSLYGRTLGMAMGGIEEVLPNREFGDLWIRFLSTVTQKYRELSSLDRTRVSAEQIHKAGRDLAVNLSLHGFGMAHPAALEMQEIVRQILGVLDEPEVTAAYGVRDRWQLVDRISALYLGGSANGVKFRTMALSGAWIIAWLARRAGNLASSSTNNLGLVRGYEPTSEFSDLAEKAERWLAVAGFAAEQAEQHIAPVDLQEQRTVPLLGQGAQLPASVRSALEQAGGIPNLPIIPQA